MRNRIDVRSLPLLALLSTCGGGPSAPAPAASSPLPAPAPPPPPCAFSAPGAPTSLRAVGRNERVQLSWMQGQPAATGFRIWRALAEDGPFEELVTLQGAVPGESPPTDYTDRRVSNGITYFYYVRGFVAQPDGNCLALGPPSATTAARPEVGEAPAPTMPGNAPPTVVFTRIYNLGPVQNPPLRPNAPAEAQIVTSDDEPLPAEREQCVGARAEGACTGATLDCTTLAGIILEFRTTAPGTCRLTVTVQDARGARGAGSASVEVKAP
jgi:hypothetical protein